MQLRPTHLFAALVTLALPTAAQSSLAWSRNHDAAPAQADYGRACTVDQAGNLLVAAKSYNPSVGFPPLPPTADFELVKWSPAGTKLWSARVDAFGGDDTPLDVACAPNGDVYTCGYGWNGNNVQIVVLKHSASGVLQWQRAHQGPGTISAFGRAVALDAAGNVLVCGHESSLASGQNAVLLCYSSAGTLLWSTGFDGGERRRLAALDPRASEWRARRVRAVHGRERRSERRARALRSQRHAARTAQ